MTTPRTMPVDVETDSRLPSGPWTGFYIQWGLRGRQDLGLEFRGGIIEGGGRDGGGMFVVRGTYDAAAGRCAMVKRYDGYQVEYDGYVDDHGIWGRWVIRYAPMMADDRGHFHIWPMGRCSQSSLTEQAETPRVAKTALSR